MQWIKRLLQPKPLRLSKAALETLAIIAYKQPVIRSDVEHIRGVDCGGVLRVLLERKFVRVLGRREIPGRPLIYATTKRFLEVFDLKNLKDLPTPKEIEEFGSALSENMDTAADDAQGDLESSPEEAPETPLETVESEPSVENLPASTEVDQAKPDQDT
jgi:segregation and condensation protein B